MASKDNLFNCNGCRIPSVIVKRAQGMSYCEKCKHKAPTKRQFEEYIFRHSRTLSMGDFKAKGKIEGSGRKTIQELDTELYDG